MQNKKRPDPPRPHKKRENLRLMPGPAGRHHLRIKNVGMGKFSSVYQEPHHLLLAIVRRVKILPYHYNGKDK
jgi:hypothetical protein